MSLLLSTHGVSDLRTMITTFSIPQLLYAVDMRATVHLQAGQVFAEEAGQIATDATAPRAAGDQAVDNSGGNQLSEEVPPLPHPPAPPRGPPAFELAYCFPDRHPCSTPGLAWTRPKRRSVAHAADRWQLQPGSTRSAHAIPGASAMLAVTPHRLAANRNRLQGCCRSFNDTICLRYALHIHRQDLQHIINIYMP